MQAGRASKTAEQMALSRAIESRRPAAERVCDDPLAERFLGLGYRSLLLTRAARDWVERAMESQFLGHHGYVLTRTRYIDDFLRDRLRDPPEQLVILGAGYDSRAHRFAGALARTKVFEVDHPATSAAKRERIARMLAAAAAPVTYVPVDFATQTLAAELPRAGYRHGVRTVFLWEGVTPYLQPGAVDAVLHFVRASGSGNAVLFDYVLASFIGGRCAMRGAGNERDRMGRTAEPLVFGIAEGEVGAWLARRGFTATVDTGGEALEQYFRERGRERYVKPWWRIVHARVA